jgi:trehalose/maltose hydrolase-like predicted phosphorylase
MTAIQIYAQNGKEGWMLSTQKAQPYSGVTLANGRIGLVSSPVPFEVHNLLLNGVYEKEFQGGVSKVLPGINFASLQVKVDGTLVDLTSVSNWEQTLDMERSELITRFDFGKKASIIHKVCALRTLPFAALVQVEVQAHRESELEVTQLMKTPDEFVDVFHSFHVLRDLETTMPIFQSLAKSKFKKHDIVASSTMIFEEERPEFKHEEKSSHLHTLSFEKKLNKGQTYKFGVVGSVCTTGDFKDPKSESERFTIFAMLEGADRLLKAHEQAWKKLWTNDIVIEGDLQSQKDVRFALYNLFSYSRDDSGLSIAPMGLSSQGYNGHVFWDTELWMYPPLLLFDQGIARSLMDYRFHRLGKAKEKASNFGYKGAMYPWESDDTGEEATPTWALTGTFEHHITADVGIAFWNFYRVNRDKQWLREKGYPVLKEVADFWVSRSERNTDGSYSIKNVVGADEFAHNIDDNAFTNGSAMTVLKYATLAAGELGLEANPDWMDVAEKLQLHRFEDGVVKEHETYKGDRIKQADVNLLSFPLGVIKDTKTIKGNLAYYETKMAEEGPAMSHSVLSILHARLGDRKKAFELFQRGYQPNQRAPFGVLSESATSNNPYFATGAGGMLQAVLFGFAGLELTDEGIQQGKTCLPRQWKSLTIKGIGVDNKTYTIRN